MKPRADSSLAAPKLAECAFAGVFEGDNETKLVGIRGKEDSASSAFDDDSTVENFPRLHEVLPCDSSNEGDQLD